MRHDAAWHAQIARVLSGALRLWGVPGAVGPDPGDPAGFIVAPDDGPALGVRRDAAARWTLTLLDPAPGVPAALGRHAGLQGLLRRLREELAPRAAAGRLVIGAQPLLGRAQGGWPQ